MNATPNQRMTQTDFFKLADYVRANGPRYQKERPLVVEVCREAASVLKLAHVTPEQVRRAAGVVGVTWESRQAAKGTGSKRITELEAEIARLRGALVLLYDRVGEEPPPTLNAPPVEPVRLTKEQAVEALNGRR